MPIIEYNNEAKFKLVDELYKNNYFFQFKKWQCIQHMNITGKTLKFDIINLYMDVTSPVWTFVAFQKNSIK